MTVFTGWPALKRIIVGIESTWKRAAVCGYFSPAVSRCAEQDYLPRRCFHNRGPELGRVRAVQGQVGSENVMAAVKAAVEIGNSVSNPVSGNGGLIS